MTTNQLKYFITVAECLNFTEAGKRHYISQTAITQHIQSLEQSLGVQLFIRSNRHVELTPAGKVFLEEAKAIITRMNLAVDRAEKAARGSTGNLSIGYVKGLEIMALSSWLGAVHEENPNLNFRLIRDNHSDLLTAVQQGKIDIAINIAYANDKLPEGVERIYLGRSKLYVILSPDHRYAQLSSIKRYDLRDEPYLMTKFYSNRTPDSLYIPEVYADSGFIPRVIERSEDIETLLLLVSAGIGITVLPEHVLPKIRSFNNLVSVPLEGDHEYVNIVALYKKDNLNPAVTTFLSYRKQTQTYRDLEQ